MMKTTRKVRQLPEAVESARKQPVGCSWLFFKLELDPLRWHGILTTKHIPMSGGTAKLIFVCDYISVEDHPETILICMTVRVVSGSYENKHAEQDHLGAESRSSSTMRCAIMQVSLPPITFRPVPVLNCRLTAAHDIVCWKSGWWCCPRRFIS